MRARVPTAELLPPARLAAPLGYPDRRRLGATASPATAFGSGGCVPRLPVCMPGATGEEGARRQHGQSGGDGLCECGIHLDSPNQLP